MSDSNPPPLSLEQKKELLRKLLQRKADESLTRFPLSFGQQALWFLYQLAPDSAAYNVNFSVRIRSPFDCAVFRQCITSLVERHPALRTTYGISDDGPVQTISSKAEFEFTEIPAIGSNQENLMHTLETEAYRPFNLEQGPLLRSTVIRDTAESYIFLLSIHHIVVDFWSLLILLNELFASYQHECGHRTGSGQFPPSQTRYREYVEWQSAMLQSAQGHRLWEYWKEKLAGDLPRLALNTDYPRPQVQSFHGHSYPFTLETNVTQRIRHFCRHEGVTPFVFLLSTFYALLFRLTGNTDLLIGTPTAGRPSARFETVVGYFVNPVVLRATLTPTVSFQEFVHQVQQTVIEAIEHQDYPFSLLVKKLQPDRDPSYSPLFQVMFALEQSRNPDQGAVLPLFQTEPGHQFRFAGLDLEPFPLLQRVARFDLTLMAIETPETFSSAFHYNADLFDPQTIARWAGNFLTLLTAALDHPEHLISHLPVLTHHERRQLVDEWNATGREFPPPHCIHQLIEAQAAQYPDRVAIRSEEKTLTYGEFNTSANQFAHYLMARGVTIESPVILCLDRSLDMMIAMLGVLKAGGAYVPVEPNIPSERLKSILLQTASPVIVTQSKYLTRIHSGTRFVVLIDKDRDFIARENRHPPQLPVKPEHLVYLIFTSGSTGTPKGVMIEHQNLANYTMGILSHLNPEPGSHFATVSTFAADLGNTAIFPALCSGGTLHIISFDRSTHPEALADYFSRNPVDYLKIVPSHLQALLSGANPAHILPRKWLITGGETCHWDLIAQVRSLAPRCRILNHYGPTETTVGVLTYPVEEHPHRAATVPLGRPLPNSTAVVVDSHLNPVPVGVAGELLLGGKGVGRGYLGNPELTQERFLVDPFPSSPGNRFFRTGDIVRCHPDGAIEFLGRADNQVKIRGFRIELGEIETALNSHPGVSKAVVKAWPFGAGDLRLCAYVQLKPAESTPAPPITASQSIITASAVQDLKGHLAFKLPEYAMPAYFVILDALPLTTNGKVNYQALPKPEEFSQSTRKGYITSRDILELQLTQIWETVLGVHSIGVRDNFFALGGHSLLAVRLMSLIEQQFGKRLPLTTLFQGATIEFLASVLRKQSRAPVWTPLVKIKSQGGKPPLFLVHPVGGNVLCYSDLSESLPPEQPLYGLQSRGMDGDDPPYTSIQEMAADYIAHLRTVQPHGPYYLGGWSLGGVIAFEMAHQLRADKESIASLVMFDSWAPIAQYKRIGSDLDMATLISGFAADLHARFQSPSVAGEIDWEQFQPGERLKGLLQLAQNAGIVPPDAEISYINRLLLVYKTNIVAVQSYEPHMYDGQVILFRAQERDGEESYNRSGGWNFVSTHPVLINEVPGNHYTMLMKPHVRHLATMLTRVFDQTFTL